MTGYDDPLEPSQLDISCEPVPQTDAAEAQQPDRPLQKSLQKHNQQPVRLYFGCCKVFAHLIPPPRVVQGKVDLWRAHCPRCGGLIEILFK